MEGQEIHCSPPPIAMIPRVHVYMRLWMLLTQTSDADKGLFHAKPSGIPIGQTAWPETEPRYKARCGDCRDGDRTSMSGLLSRPSWVYAPHCRSLKNRMRSGMSRAHRQIAYLGMLLCSLEMEGLIPCDTSHSREI